MYQKDLLKDKIALITGGRSGIGFGIARHFLQLGAKVFICSRKEAPLKEATQQLAEWGECACQVCDIRNTEEIAALAEAVKKRFGRLDILVNNAGGQFPALAEKISENGWTSVINNNLNGTFFVSQQMAKSFFIPQQEGNIVNIIADIYRGFPGMVHTGAARAGVENMTKTLAQEWARFNIRVNAIAPGVIVSSGLDTYAKPIQQSFEAIRQDLLMKRLGTVEDVSNVVCFYASPLSSYTSGTTLYVDGLAHLHSNKMGFVNLLSMMG